jgi:aminoglycoside phosphotransferase (APT) family kinase protein
MEGTNAPEAVAAAAVVSLPEIAPVEQLAPVPKGHRHECWRIQGPVRTVMLKLALHSTTPVAMANLGQALQLVDEGGVPSPRLLWSGTAPASLGSRPMLIQEYLPGTDGYASLETLDSQQLAAFYKDWGAAVGCMHAIKPTCFSSSISEPRRCHATWRDLVEERLALLVPLNRDARMLSDRVLDEATAQIVSGAARSSDLVRPALSHGDLHTPNTLVNSGRFVAILDFEHAKFWDAVFDFVKLRMWTFESQPGSEAPFMEGYQSTAPPLDRFEDRLRVCTGLELLAGLPYWKKSGEEGLLEDYMSRFERWLDSVEVA